MNMPQIQISTTRAVIGLQSDKRLMSIQQRPADLQIQQQHVDNLQISKRASQLLIDQTEAFADANIKGPLRRADEFAQQAQQTAMTYIQKKAQEGDQLMKIENGGGAISRVAAQASKLKTFDFNIGFIPRPLSVKMSYDPGETTFQVNRDTVEIKVNKNDPQITIPKWQSDAYLKQKHSISFDVVGTQVNRGL